MSLMDSLSDKLSPNDIKNKEFAKSIRGFSQTEVIDFLSQVAKTWEEVQKKEKKLLKKIDELKIEVQGWETKAADLDKIKELALNDAQAIRLEATKEAERIFLEMEEKAKQVRAKTEEWLTEVISKIEETERQKSNFVRAFRSSLDSHYELLKKEEEEKESLGNQLSHILKSEPVSLHQH